MLKNRRFKMLQKITFASEDLFCILKGLFARKTLPVTTDFYGNLSACVLLHVCSL